MEISEFENTDTPFDGVFKESDGATTEKLAMAYDLYNSGKYQEVLSMCESDSQISSLAYGQVLIGNCYKNLNDKNSAMSHWKKAVEISPLEYSAYANIANQLYSEGKINEAILNWHIATTIMPENPNVNLNLALAYDKKGSRIKATKYFEKYVRYEKKIGSHTYVNVKNTLFKLTSKVDYFAQKVEEYKAKKDLKTIAALYLKMISTYANLPNIYANIAEIFYYDRNFEKALEFYLLVYLNYPHTPRIILEIANLYYVLQQPTYAYAYYKKVIDLLPEGTSYYNKVKSNLSALEYVLNEHELISVHLDKAREAEQNNDYEIAVAEYENYLILTQSENSDMQQIIDKYKIFMNPEQFVINVLANEISDLMSKKKLNACIDVCDRIMRLATHNTKEVMYALKCKTECKRILIAQEQFGV